MYQEKGEIYIDGYSVVVYSERYIVVYRYDETRNKIRLSGKYYKGDAMYRFYENLVKNTK